VRDSHKGSPADYDPNLIPRWHFSWYLVKPHKSAELKQVRTD